MRGRHGFHAFRTSIVSGARSALLLLTALAPLAAWAGGSNIVVGTSGSPSTFGASVTFTATLSGVVSPTGTDTFCADATTTNASCTGGTVLCALPVGASPVQCATTALTVGTHAITAFYSGDGGNQPAASGAISQVVNQATSNTTLVSDTNPSTVGQTVTFTATVNGQSPTGTVTFNDGAGAICSSVALSGTSAQCVISTFTGGTHSISAVYSGDAGNTGSTSNTVMQTVNPGSSSTALVSSANPSISAQNVTFTATVTGHSPTGTVTFLDGAQTICSVALSSGSAACVTNTLAIGAHSISAMYGGDANNASSTSNTIAQQVQKQTTISLNSTANPSTYAQNVTFTALISGSAPTGTISFTDNGVAMCTAVAVNSASAQCAQNPLSVGAHSIVASYTGDSNNTASVSAAFNQQVNPAPSVTVLDVSANPTSYDTSLTFTATVSGQAPTGTVTFNDGAAAMCANAPLSAGVATCTLSTLLAGLHPISSTYSGDTNNAPSTSNGFTEQVNRADTITTLTTTCIKTFVENQPITLVASVNGTGPTGTVDFLVNGFTVECDNVPLVSKSASCVISDLTNVGGNPTAYGLSASYSGDSNYRSSNSAAVQVTVLSSTDVVFRNGFDAQTVNCPVE